MDHCDRCGAPARTRYIKGNSDMLFCAHHTKEYRDKILMQGFKYDYEYEKLNDLIGV